MRSFYEAYFKDAIVTAGVATTKIGEEVAAKAITTTMGLPQSEQGMISASIFSFPSGPHWWDLLTLDAYGVAMMA